MSLRESHAFTLWATERVLAHIHANPVFSVLNRDFVNFRTLKPRETFYPLEGLETEAFEVPGKVPLYDEAGSGHAVRRDGNTFGLHARRKNRTLSYVPGCGDIDDELLGDLRNTDALLFDGTLHMDDEMISSGTGFKTGRRMGHVPVSGDDGSIAQLASLPASSRIFVHMNNTNPLLISGSPERKSAESKHWKIAYDGMEIIP